MNESFCYLDFTWKQSYLVKFCNFFKFKDTKYGKEMISRKMYLIKNVLNFHTVQCMIQFYILQFVMSCTTKNISTKNCTFKQSYCKNQTCVILTKSDILVLQKWPKIAISHLFKCRNQYLGHFWGVRKSPKPKFAPWKLFKTSIFHCFQKDSFDLG